MANRNFASRLPREGLPITACASLCFMQSLPHTVHVTFVSPAFGGVLICGVAATPITPSFYASIGSIKEHVTILGGGGVENLDEVPMH